MMSRNMGLEILSYNLRVTLIGVSASPSCGCNQKILIYRFNFLNVEQLCRSIVGGEHPFAVQPVSTRPPFAALAICLKRQSLLKVLSLCLSVFSVSYAVFKPSSYDLVQ